MAWFFTEPFTGEYYTITGEDAKHIEKSLRMKIDEEITLVDSDSIQHKCVIDEIFSGSVTVRVLERFPCENEPDIKVTLYQALPKGDKMDTIIQKAVELGVTEIVPVISARCISRPDGKSMAKKIQRWQKIALQAAQQSRRGIIPQVKPELTFKQAVSTISQQHCNIIFYECGGDSIGKVVNNSCKQINMFIGSEGGFEPQEVQQVIEKNGYPLTLGKRVLRAETAPLAGLAVIMYVTGNMDSTPTEKTFA